ncbi:signal peptide peptidase SppA [Alistipes senegalensis]|uniref:signal peptide peptidase SppA n=1 Tax=Alistipes senegalensis TaxID=1288121 RepID=UPI002431637C|nr:signal peptide peptidase SppA [Alistipes senegalensis]MCI7308895.1 signal peptide peptidase SppA [Alistipes senegalensis]MDD7039210.1 signal peptide peptidase SppA [Alistipes senegalensis]MDY2877034.1 signal peptide peptidase SppA [Alistipes senegalensis]
MNFVKTFLAGLLAVIVGTFLVFFLWIFILLGIAGSMEKSVAVHPESILKIDFSEVLTDAPSSDPLAGIDLMTLQTTRQLSLFKVLRAIEAAGADDRIKGIYLRMNGGGGVTGSALLEELREALLEFKQSGKFIVAYNETYSQGQYYLASVADKIYLQPEGGMEWSGLASDVMFYKGLLDKLDLRAEVFRPTACKYKSAVEPFILDKMSAANREQMQALVNSMWGTISGAVCESRGIDSVKMRRITDNLQVTLPEEALEYGFVDSLLYEDQMEDVFAELGVSDDYDFITLGDYASQVGADLKNISADQVAIVYADGQIVDGEGYGKEIYGNTLAAKIAGVRDDEKVKAVVLRVNSPGGSALASDVIWREVELLRAEKPVVVSMGSYAASGGYYISCPADVIVADKLTLTGSIGVFGMILDTREALKNKLGITIDGVQSNASSSFLATQPLTPVQRSMIMRGVDKVYTTFTNDVAEGRNLPIEKVLDIAGGRVWSGADALGIGLIDTYGGLKTAIALAVDKADLGDNYRVTEVTETPTGFAAFIASLNMSVREAFTRSELGLMMKDYNTVREAFRQQGVLMYSPYKVEIR